MALVATAKNQTQEMILVTLAEAIAKTKAGSKMKAPPLMEMPVTKAGSNQSSNPSVNLTAGKLRLQVPSALRAPAAGYLQR